MAPDLNSLPPSRSSSLSNSRPSPSRPPSHPPTQLPINAIYPTPTTASTSSTAGLPALQTLHHSPQLSPRSRPPPRMERRRSSNLINDSLTSSAAHSPTLDHNMLPNPQHHHRAPSLGELHQELESEHEAQVNRLLAQIRLEQDTITALERHNAAPPQGATSSTHPVSTGPPTAGQANGTALHTRTSISGLGDASAPLPPRSRTPSSTGSRSRPQSMGQSIVPRASLANLNMSGASAQHPSAPREPGRGSASASLSRRSSMQSRHSERSSSRTSRRGDGGLSGGVALSSPPWGDGAAGSDGWATGMGLASGRDEASFVATETAMVTRENQMLKARIRELERMLADRDGAGGEGIVG